MAEYETILTERRGDVLTLTLNRPDRLDAASIRLAEELTGVLHKPDGARCVVDRDGACVLFGVPAFAGEAR